MARLRIPLQARRCVTSAALEHSTSAAPGLADVVRCARRPKTPAVVFAFPRTVAAKRTHSDSAAGEQSLPGQAADLCARAVLRLHLCQQRGTFRWPMVGPEIAGTVLPRRASERD